MAMHNKVQGYEDTAPFQQPAVHKSLLLSRSVQFDTNLEGIHHQPKSHCGIRRKTRVQMVASTCQVSAKQHCCLSFRVKATLHGALTDFHGLVGSPSWKIPSTYGKEEEMEISDKHEDEITKTAR
ncbi:hypothetical protein HID58_047480 [Brassica napus]|uniref:Uncharacterized protein n=1 Tax=Brassica napus TaxID=3708 RepID=A0ABQ8AZH7_BRANA|nr:hypothetical protein HID58_047480 [Brassica napus]